ncbi:MAG: ABC transporter substrate-binding protein [Candidatus Baltobacteraceae bacterium]
MNRLTRGDFARSLAAGAAAAAGAPLLGAGPAPSGDAAALYDAAKKEGKVVWWTAHYAQGPAERARDAFIKKYPGIEVELLRQTAQTIFLRLSQGLKSGVHEVDVFASTDEAHYPVLKKQGALVAYAPPDIRSLSKQFAASDPDNTYHTGAIGFVLINYAKKVTAPPRRWTELTDAKWKDQLTTGHPAFSGYVGQWVLAMNDKYGWDYFKKIAANNPKIGRSVNDTVADIVSGERSVGAGPDNLSIEQRNAGRPIDVVFPEDDAIAIISPVGIIKDSPHPNAAKLFENFYYSREYSAAMAQTANFPLRDDVKNGSGVDLAKLKTYRNKSERLAVGVPEVIAKWRETFNV